MSFNDHVSDLITRIRNAQMVYKKEVVAPYTKLSKSILDVLDKEGYIEGYSIDNEDNPSSKNIVINLKYSEGIPVISKIKRISKSGRRIYSSIDSMPKNYNGLGIYILSTSKGVVSDHYAREIGVGGEVLCSVF